MNISNSTSDFAIIILSCDKYADLWPGFFHQLKKMMDTPIKKYLVTNYLDYKDSYTSNLQIIRNGDDSDWSSNILSALEKISEKKIFIILEDIFISSKVRNLDFERLVQFSFEADVQHIKYMSYPAAKIPYDDLLSQYEPGMPYLVSVCGIWDKGYLKSLILEGESPWEFEVNASYRAKFSANQFYGCNKPLFQYKNMVEKGGWIPASINWALANGVPIDASGRSINKVSWYHVKRLIFRLSMRIPWRIRVCLVSILKKMVISY